MPLRLACFRTEYRRRLWRAIEAPPCFCIRGSYPPHAFRQLWSVACVFHHSVFHRIGYVYLYISVFLWAGALVLICPPGSELLVFPWFCGRLSVVFRLRVSCYCFHVLLFWFLLAPGRLQAGKVAQNIVGSFKNQGFDKCVSLHFGLAFGHPVATICPRFWCRWPVRGSLGPALATQMSLQIWNLWLFCSPWLAEGARRHEMGAGTPKRRIKWPQNGVPALENCNLKCVVCMCRLFFLVWGSLDSHPVFSK